MGLKYLFLKQILISSKVEFLLFLELELLLALLTLLGLLLGAQHLLHLLLQISLSSIYLFLYHLFITYSCLSVSFSLSSLKGVITFFSISNKVLN